MQAILTTYHGPTESLDHRITARCDARRKTYPYDDALSIEENHACAAKMLAQSLGWLDRGERTYTIHSGSLPGGSWCHVLVRDQPMGEPVVRDTAASYRTAQPITRGSSYRKAHEIYLDYRGRFSGENRECFLAIALDGKGRPRREHLVSVGSLTASLVHPREVFEPLIRSHAAAVILLHNHPSGDPTPSREDIEITHRLRQVGDLIGIRVVDHVVVAIEGYASFAEMGWP